MRLFSPNALAQGLANNTWQSWTPTITAAAGTFTTTSADCEYMRFGNLVLYRCLVQVTDKGTAIADLRISTPPGLVPVSSSCGCGREAFVTGKIVQTMTIGGSGAIVCWFKDNTFPGENGYGLRVDGFYEVNV